MTEPDGIDPHIMALMRGLVREIIALPEPERSETWLKLAGLVFYNTARALAVAKGVDITSEFLIDETADALKETTLPRRLPRPAGRA